MAERPKGGGPKPGGNAPQRPADLRARVEQIKHSTKVYTYPSGVMDIVCSTAPDFGPKGWEIAENYGKAPASTKPKPKQDRASSDPEGEDLERSMRRARAKVRRLALANDFRWFVTLTLDKEKVDRYDMAAITKKLNAWCSNMVQRKGLRYILVPERHQDGAIHFHGFFNDVVRAVPSGHMDRQGHEQYNLPQWTLGFTTGIELYGKYTAAVAYVCKYIGKQGEKPGGRWYYSGGDLQEPKAEYADMAVNDLIAAYPEKVWTGQLPGRMIAVVNGIEVPEQVQKEDMEE